MALLWLWLFSWQDAHAAGKDLCEILNMQNCSGVSRQTRRASAPSLPSTATAAQFNPANVSHDRGLGVETFYQPGQSPTFSFVTGTGRAGAALVSSQIENAFFGARVPELAPDYLERREDDEQYHTQKYTLAMGAALWRGRHFGFDLGFQGKYNPKIKRINPGIGLSARAWIFSLGFTSYQDDMFLEAKNKINPQNDTPYNVEWDDGEYQERYQVQNVFGGVRLGKFFLDAGQIRSYNKFQGDYVTIRLLSAALIWERFLFNLARRQETSPFLKYEDGELVEKKAESSTYAGIQYSAGKRFVFGVHYNYFLLNEWSGSLALFF